MRVPVNSFEFHSCERTPQVDYFLNIYKTIIKPTSIIHLSYFNLDCFAGLCLDKLTQLDVYKRQMRYCALMRY